MSRYPRLGILCPGLSPQFYYTILLYDCEHLTSMSVNDSICETGTHSRVGEEDKFHTTFL